MSLFEVRDLTVSYPHATGRTELFSGVSFALDERTVYDLVGSSGSGKSTLLRACARMLPRDKGEFFLDGEPSDAVPQTLWRRRVCLVPQKPSLVAGTVRDNLVLPWTLKVYAGEVPPTDSELAELLVCAELGDIELSRPASQLSGGQLARVALLRVFAARPRVLLLDEVDAALDAESARAIGKLTQTLVGDGMTCLRIRHRAADGFAKGAYRLEGGVLSYSDYAASSLGLRTSSASLQASGAPAASDGGLR